MNETVPAIFTSKRIAGNDQRTCVSVESNQPHISPVFQPSIDRISEVDALNAQEKRCKRAMKFYLTAELFLWSILFILFTLRPLKVFLLVKLFETSSSWPILTMKIHNQRFYLHN